MNRFALPHPTLVTVEHINVRDESHGDDKVPAIDVKLSLETSNDVLALFHPLLKAALYVKSDSPLPPQGTLELGTPVDLPNLRWPQLQPLRWHEDLDNRTLTIDYGIGGKSALKLTDCKANDFRIEPKEGGTVKVTWRVQRSQPDERVIGKLAGLLKREVEATLVGSPETQALMGAADGDETDEGDEAWPFPEGMGEVAKDATDTFVEQHGRGHA